ncbi:MAG: hypothetical protein SH820_06235 [Xanthomonadales bacterium]|nr:hypothetical protein [Xanthomonadales bacterium]
MGKKLDAICGAKETCAMPHRQRAAGRIDFLFKMGLYLCTALCSIKDEGKGYMSKRDEYVAKMKSQLDAINAQLDKLADKSKSTKKELQDKYKKEMADLRAQSKKASAKLDELKTTGEAGWDKMVAEMEKVGNAFKHSFRYFKSQL